MFNSGSAYERYTASVQNRRACQDVRDALGYVDADHPDHPNNADPVRRRAIQDADAALTVATTEMQDAFAALGPPG